MQDPHLANVFVEFIDGLVKTDRVDAIRIVRVWACLTGGLDTGLVVLPDAVGTVMPADEIDGGPAHVLPNDDEELADVFRSGVLDRFIDADEDLLNEIVFFFPSGDGWVPTDFLADHLADPDYGAV